jgi:hypothetical protein
MFTAAMLVIGVQIELQARGFGARGGVAVGPRGGVGVGHARGGVGVGPFGGVHAGGARGGSYVTPRGTTIQHGGIGGVSRGPFGGVHAGGAQGTRITTPGGRTYTSGSAGRVGVGPYGGVHARGVGGASVRTPYGGSAVRYGGAARVGPVGGATIRYGSGARVGSYGGVAVGRGAVAVGHRTRYYGSTALRAHGTYVRTGFRYNCFTPTWYRAHTAAWVAPRWYGRSIWVAPTWPVISGYCGIVTPPVYYDYGSTVIIENDNVYVNGNPVATAASYADQATQYADIGRQAKPAQDGEWQALGVWGMVQGEGETTAQHIFQLAVDKGGIVRGNYYDAVADNSMPVYGSVDRKSQRVAWSIGDKKDIVFETGLNNLTREETSLLVHYGKERTEQMVLVRLEEPREGQTP